MKGLGQDLAQSKWHISFYSCYYFQRSSTCFHSSRKPSSVVPNPCSSVLLRFRYLFSANCTAEFGVLLTCRGQVPHLSLFVPLQRPCMNKVGAGMQVQRPPCLCPALPAVAEVSEMQQGARDPAALRLWCLGWEGNWVPLLLWAALYIPQKVPCQNL